MSYPLLCVSTKRPQLVLRFNAFSKRTGIIGLRLAYFVAYVP